MDSYRSIDWNEVWKEVGIESMVHEGVNSCIVKYSNPEECRKYDRRTKENNWKKSNEIIEKIKLSSKTKVLDIGAGPGTLSIPISKMVETVTAVEPSTAMVKCLKDNIENENIKNIKVVKKSWEEIDIDRDLDPPYDIVICSYSLGMNDLKKALSKMDKVSNNYCYIFWFVNLTPWELIYADIWDELHGTKYKMMRKADIVYNLLYQMQIYANVDVFLKENVSKYSTIEEAISEQKNILQIKTKEQEDILKAYLKKKLPIENGQYVLRGKSHHAKIWWNKE